MRILVVAVGVRMPAWVTQAVDEYSGRMPADYAVQWREIRPEPRDGRGSPQTWMQREADRIRTALPPAAHRVVLDERGRDIDTRELARSLSRWRDNGRSTALIIGGPDGLDAQLRSEAHETLRLSSLTLPHPMVRVVLAEQLYRAWSILAGHPYHRA